MSARVTILVSGEAVFDGPLTDPSPVGDRGAGSLPSARWQFLSQLCLEVPVAGDPLVYLSGVSGGASCCALQRVYFQDATGHIVTVDENFGRVPGTTEELYGDVIMVTGDPAFSGAFACEACSGNPVTIYQFEDSQFVDVTRGFPVQIRQDADRWWNLVQQNLGTFTGVDGLVPPWAADECELGEQARAFATLQTMEQAGDFPPGSAQSGESYVQAVETFLVQQGYCT